MALPDHSDRLSPVSAGGVDPLPGAVPAAARGARRRSVSRSRDVAFVARLAIMGVDQTTDGGRPMTATQQRQSDLMHAMRAAARQYADEYDREHRRATLAAAMRCGVVRVYERETEERTA